MSLAVLHVCCLDYRPRAISYSVHVFYMLSTDDFIMSLLVCVVNVIVISFYIACICLMSVVLITHQR